ncbi:MAG: SDR family oxidoreductase [Erysipelotrichaceae bacterium]|nr:SDR family oxidoreductase [Erysipelotrichaceae bacterium]
MKVLITGSSRGIGKAIALKFLSKNHQVYGIDILPSSINNENYIHYQCDIFNDELPQIDNVEILINNAGVQNDNDIDINLKGTIKVSEKYGFNESIKSILFIVSASATTGSEFPLYVASKGGILSYMKNVAQRVAKFNATANSISPGGVNNEFNEHILNDKKLYDAVLNETLLHKWADVDEIASWAYFVSVINKSMTGQDIIIDNGESINYNFIW